MLNSICSFSGKNINWFFLIDTFILTHCVCVSVEKLPECVVFVLTIWSPGLIMNAGLFRETVKSLHLCTVGDVRAVCLVFVLVVVLSRRPSVLLLSSCLLVGLRSLSLLTCVCSFLLVVTAAPIGHADWCFFYLYVQITKLHVQIGNLYVQICNLYLQISNLPMQTNYTYVHISVYNLYVQICNMYVQLSNLYVHISNLYVQISNLYVQISNLYVQISNLYVQISNLYVLLICMYR